MTRGAPASTRRWNRCPAEPMTVALYVAALADVRKASTIRRRLNAISVVHQLAGFDSPTSDAAVQALWKGTRRTKGTAPAKKRAARTKVVASLVAPLGTSLGDVRDRALLLIGFAGALRRSELVALNVEDVTEDGDGLVVTVRRSKGDQEAQGELPGIPYGSKPANVRCGPGERGLKRRATPKVRHSVRSLGTGT